MSADNLQPSQTSTNPDPINAEQKILELCAQLPDGLSDLMLQSQMPQVTAQQRLAALNRLLSQNKLDLFKSPQGVVYKLKDPRLDPSTGSASENLDEKLVYGVIKESGSKGIWIRDISIKTNVKSTALNKALKSLESRKLIKSVQSVNANKKKVYMLFELEPDRSITGGAWYSGKEFESEFVEILNEQCFRYLCDKREQINTNSKYANDPLLKRNAQFATSKEIRDFIQSLGISKINLSVEDIECILNTLVYDGKVEKSVVANSTAGGAGEHIFLFRAVYSILSSQYGSSVVRTPCGICPLIDQCHPDGIINPRQCVYMKEWLEF